MLVYVDDILVTGSCVTSVNSTIDQLATRFSPKDLGDINYFLGIEVLRTADALFCHKENISFTY